MVDWANLIGLGLGLVIFVSYTGCANHSVEKMVSYPQCFTSIGDFSKDPQSSFDTDAVHPSCPESLRPKAKRLFIVSTRECWAPPAVAIASWHLKKTNSSAHTREKHSSKKLALKKTAEKRPKTNSGVSYQVQYTRNTLQQHVNTKK